jgi:glyoxylase I family protein
MTGLFTAIHHASLLVADTRRSLAFYQGVLGMETVARPDLGFPGAWLAVGQQQIHLLELPSPDPVTGRPDHGGRDRHVAILTTDLDALEDRLSLNRVPFSRSKSGRSALFCRDPDGNTLEIIAIADGAA